MGQQCVFKLDTGAEVSAISEELYDQLGKPPLRLPSKVLYGPSQQPLSVLGEFDASLRYMDNSACQTLYVIKGLRTNLMGLPAITALNLIARLDQAEDYMSRIVAQHPALFQGLGKMGEPYHIRLKDDAKPYAVYTARSIPLPMREKVQKELKRMEALGVISSVEGPTEWCAPIVAVPKHSGGVRICVDMRALNVAVRREQYHLPKVDETLAKLAGAVKFSKLDANSGFWQVPLSNESRQLTTFTTPWGRHCFNRLPFGICSAQEVFQKRMSKILEGIDGVVCQVDDVLIYGKTDEEHDARLEQALKRIEEAGTTLNREKCVFNTDTVDFLGHRISKEGISPDPKKVEAVLKMTEPTCVADVRRFLGMANYLGKFSGRLAEISRPLQELLCKNKAWSWGEMQSRAFQGVKQELARPSTLALYDPKAPTKISADASSWALGGVLLQEQKGSWRPIAYASRVLSEVECRYAQIEREALAVVWACERFAEFVLGLEVSIETDHKPLVPLLGEKRLDCLPPRILRFRLRLDRFSYTIKYVPGKEMYAADALSRAAVANPGNESKKFQEEVEAFVHSVVYNLPGGDEKLREYAACQMADPVCKTLQKYCNEGWPDKSKLSKELETYWEARGRLNVAGDLLLYDHRIVVPAALQREALQKVHAGHQGIVRCKERCKMAIWWPGLMSLVNKVVKSCRECAKHTEAVTEPMLSSELPDYPWQRVASDLFYSQGKNYILLTDYFSRYPEVVQLNNTTSQGVIRALKAVFSRVGVPELLRCDNGPQYTSQEMKEFAEEWGFQILTSSPHFPRSNGLAERTVRTIKDMLVKSKDLYLSLLCYRATPLNWCGRSPAELLFGRKIRDNLPQRPENFIPEWSYLSAFRGAEREYKGKQKTNYDRRHRARQAPVLEDSTPVWVSTDERQVPGTVITHSKEPRSYLVKTPSGEVRRNRQDLRAIPTNGEKEGKLQNQDNEKLDKLRSSPIQTRSKTGIVIKPPERLYF